MASGLFVLCLFFSVVCGLLDSLVHLIDVTSGTDETNSRDEQKKVIYLRFIILNCQLSLLGVGCQSEAINSGMPCSQG